MMSPASFLVFDFFWMVKKAAHHLSAALVKMPLG
jgi:hypothetical protein